MLQNENITPSSLFMRLSKWNGILHRAIRVPLLQSFLPRLFCVPMTFIKRIRVHTHARAEGSKGEAVVVEAQRKSYAFTHCLWIILKGKALLKWFLWSNIRRWMLNTLSFLLSKFYREKLKSYVYVPVTIFFTHTQIYTPTISSSWCIRFILSVFTL